VFLEQIKPILQDSKGRKELILISVDELVVKERLVYEAVLSWADKECKRRNLQVKIMTLRQIWRHP
jgi:hypothetical protein